MQPSRPTPSPRVDRDGFSQVSDAPTAWDDRTASLGLQDVRYAVSAEGVAKITINRPANHNSFRPITVDELERTLALARNDVKVGVIILTGEGPNAFCAGGDQSVRGDGQRKESAALVEKPRGLDWRCDSSQQHHEREVVEHKRVVAEAQRLERGRLRKGPEAKPRAA